MGMIESDALKNKQVAQPEWPLGLDACIKTVDKLAQGFVGSELKG